MSCYYTSKPYVKTPEKLRRALMNFQRYDGLWSVHFIDADCRTPIGIRTRYIDFATIDELRALVIRCNPDKSELAEFEQDIKRWGRGSIYVNLTSDQIRKLQ